MPVNQVLSNYSDMAFQSAFVVYVVALIIALVFYGRMQAVIKARRELSQSEPEAAKEKELVSVNAGASSGAGAGDKDEAASPSDGAATPLSSPELEKAEARADKLAGMVHMVVWLGAILHLATIVLRGLAVHRFPLGNLYEYMLMFTFFVVVAGAIVLQRKSRRILWPWFLTPMLALMFYGGTKLYADAAPVVPALQSHWVPIHVTTVVFGASIGMISGVFSVLFLLRLWQEPGQEHGIFGVVARPLPTAKRLDTFAYRTAILTLPVFGLGILFGAIWAESAWGHFWQWDPKETVSLVTWVMYAAYLHARATAGWKTWGAAIINVVALATMIFNLFFINLVVQGLHSYAGLN